MKKITLLSLSTISFLMFTGCTGGYNYYGTSNPSGAKVYCGTEPNNLHLCFTTPYERLNSASLGWSNSYFQAKKEGYIDSEIYQHPATNDVGRVHFELKTLEVLKVEQEKIEEKINAYILNEDYKNLKELIDENPEYIKYIKNDAIRLSFVGPKGLRIGEISSFLQKGKSESLVISLINNNKKPYKQFSLDEIELLQSMGISDKVIEAMINVTSKYAKTGKISKSQNKNIKRTNQVTTQSSRQSQQQSRDAEIATEVFQNILFNSIFD
ncbi:hypothetical protein [Halarcobacter sp.]|uniref:hypothetical protein n=1 Tax=Halarcobacter sp. TaxID=2321133 RepID=UPI002AAA9946|nr:hypothetical protein [Halarcobacter sp.]